MKDLTYTLYVLNIFWRNLFGVCITLRISDFGIFWSTPPQDSLDLAERRHLSDQTHHHISTAVPKYIYLPRFRTGHYTCTKERPLTRILRSYRSTSLYNNLHVYSTSPFYISFLQHSMEAFLQINLWESFILLLLQLINIVYMALKYISFS
jgi:hypothetical protein